MSYEIVKKLKCIANEKLNNEGFVNLTIGEIYDSVYSNSTVNSESFGVFDNNGNLYEFSKRYFEIIETKIRKNTGWEIKCKDCCLEIKIEEIIKNNKCPRCGQIFSTEEE